jgi:hypothetical protein
MLDVSIDPHQTGLMKQKGTKKQKVKVIRVKKAVPKPAKINPILPLPAAWER